MLVMGCARHGVGNHQQDQRSLRSAAAARFHTRYFGPLKLTCMKSSRCLDVGKWLRGEQAIRAIAAGFPGRRVGPLLSKRIAHSAEPHQLRRPW
jgi:hypothetical protein